MVNTQLFLTYEQQNDNNQTSGCKTTYIYHIQWYLLIRPPRGLAKSGRYAQVEYTLVNHVGTLCRRPL